MSGSSPTAAFSQTNSPSIRQGAVQTSRFQNWCREYPTTTTVVIALALAILAPLAAILMSKIVMLLGFQAMAKLTYSATLFVSIFAGFALERNILHT